MQPERSEKCWRCDHAGKAVTGWRPLPGLEVPGTHPDKWELKKRIGTGGFGAAWLANNRSNSKKLRVFKFCYDLARARSFRREKKLFDLLNEALEKDANLWANIAAVERSSLESSPSEGGAEPQPPYWIQSQHYEHGNLLQWALAAYGKPEDQLSADLSAEETQGRLSKALGLIPMEVRLHLWVELARTVHAVHQHGILHRDIKPANIFIRLDPQDGSPHPVLADFGIGMIDDLSRLTKFGVTQGGFVGTEFNNDSSRTGTAYYMPPEALRGEKPSPAWDIYALGVLLYQMVRGDASQPLSLSWDQYVSDPLLRSDVKQAVVDAPDRWPSAEKFAENVAALQDRRKIEDDAQRKEALRQAEQELAEAKSKARKRRILTIAMAVLTLGAVVGGLLAYRESIRADKEASAARESAEIASVKTEEAQMMTFKAQKEEKTAVKEKQIAEEGFQHAFASFENLYQSYHNNTIGNIPGVHLRQARALREALRAQMRSELERLHSIRPDHRGCMTLLCQLELEAIRAAREEWDWQKARQSADCIKKWLDLLGDCSAQEIEVCGDFWFWYPLCIYYTEGKEQGVASVQWFMGEVLKLRSKYPASKRLHFTELRLRNAALADNPNASKDNYLDLDRELEKLGQLASGNTEVALYRLIVLGNAFQKSPQRLEMPLNVADRFLKIFETDILGTSKATSYQIEQSSLKFSPMLNCISPKLSTADPPSEVEEKKGMLRRLQTILKKMEVRCPFSPDIFASRSEFLGLENRCLKAGIGLMQEAALQGEIERHRQRAAASGVASSIRETLEPALAPAAKTKITDAEKDAMKAAIDDVLGDITALGLEGMDSLVDGTNLSTLLSMEMNGQEKDPLKQSCAQIFQHYVDVFSNSSLSNRTLYLEAFAKQTGGMCELWKSKGEIDRLIAFWHTCYDGIDIAAQTSGDRESLVNGASYTICSLIEKGSLSEAESLYRATATMSRKILEERPWDYYLHEADLKMHFDVAEAYRKAGKAEVVQRCLRSGWESTASLYRKKIDLTRFNMLPQRDGNAPDGCTDDEKSFFSQLKPQENGGNPPKLFVIFCDVNDTKVPVQFYIPKAETGFLVLLDQFRWIKEYRGVEINKETVEGFRHPDKIALQHGTDLATIAEPAKWLSREHARAEFPKDNGKRNSPDYQKMAGLLDSVQLNYPIKIGANAVRTDHGNPNISSTNSHLFVLPCSIHGRPNKLTVCVPQTDDGYTALLDQLCWAALYKGVDLSSKTFKEFEDLHDIAVENKVSFSDLCSFALEK